MALRNGLEHFDIRRKGSDSIVTATVQTPDLLEAPRSHGHAGDPARIDLRPAARCGVRATGRVLGLSLTAKTTRAGAKFTPAGRRRGAPAAAACRRGWHDPRKLAGDDLSLRSVHDVRAVVADQSRHGADGSRGRGGAACARGAGWLLQRSLGGRRTGSRSHSLVGRDRSGGQGCAVTAGRNACGASTCGSTRAAGRPSQ